MFSVLSFFPPVGLSFLDSVETSDVLLAAMNGYRLINVLLQGIFIVIFAGKNIQSILGSAGLC